MAAELFAGIAAGAGVALAVVLLVARRGTRGDAELYRQLGELTARVSELERHGSDVRGSLDSLGQRLTHTGAVIDQVQQATEAVRLQLQRAAEQLASLDKAADHLRDTDRQNAEVLRRLELLLAGTATKGAAGESIVEALFRQLPSEWQARNVPVEGRVVEFGLRLPNGLIVPIDSKWPATGLVEELLNAPDPGTAARIRQQVVQQVRAKMEEVQKYLHPELTAGFGIAVVPDAVFEAAAEAQVEGLRMNVVLLGYGSLVPYLLLVVHVTLRSGTTVDAERLAGAVGALRQSFAAMNEELNQRFSKALTMLGNSRQNLQLLIGNAQAALLRLETRGEPLALQTPTTEAEESEETDAW